jgi:hypothetical protein
MNARAAMMNGLQSAAAMMVVIVQLAMTYRVVCARLEIFDRDLT